jgi:hypothetical protein
VFDKSLEQLVADPAFSPSEEAVKALVQLYQLVHEHMIAVRDIERKSAPLEFRGAAQQHVAAVAGRGEQSPSGLRSKTDR